MKDITNFFNDMIFASNNGSPNTEKKKDINNNPEKTNSTNIDKDFSNNTENILQIQPISILLLIMILQI